MRRLQPLTRRGPPDRGQRGETAGAIAEAVNANPGALRADWPLVDRSRLCIGMPASWEVGGKGRAGHVENYLITRIVGFTRPGDCDRVRAPSHIIGEQIIRYRAKDGRGVQCYFRKARY